MNKDQDLIGINLSEMVNQPRGIRFKKCQIKLLPVFCFEKFEVSLELDSSFTGNNIEIYDCEFCCNPNKLDYEVYVGQIKTNNVSYGNE